jgi:cyclase
VAEIVEEPGDLELVVIGDARRQDVRTLQGVGEDVDRIAVGTERVARSIGACEHLEDLVDARGRLHLHTRHGTVVTVTDAPALELTEIAEGVYAWLQPGGETGVSNAGVVVDDDGLTVIDTLMVRSQWEPFAAAVAELDRTVKRVVLTHAHIDHVGGTTAFRNAMILGTQYTSDLLDQSMPLDAYKAFMPAFAEEFDDLAEAGTRPVSHIVDDAAQMTYRTELLPANGHTDGDLMVLVADADVLFAGDLCFFGVTPLGFQGDPATWVNVLDAVAGLAETIVPGHGPIGGETEVRLLQEYLRHCVEGKIPPGPWDAWPEREQRDPINIEKAAMLREGDGGMPPSMLRAIGL